MSAETSRLNTASTEPLSLVPCVAPRAQLIGLVLRSRKLLTKPMLPQERLALRLVLRLVLQEQCQSRLRRLR